MKVRLRKTVYINGRLYTNGHELEVDDELTSKLVKLGAAERVAEPAPSPQPQSAAGRKRKAKEEEARPEQGAEVA